MRSFAEIKIQKKKKKETDLDGFIKTALFSLVTGAEKDNAAIHQCRGELILAYHDEYDNDWSLPFQVNHVAQASFQVDAFGRKFVLDVELNQWVLDSWICQCGWIPTPSFCYCYCLVDVFIAEVLVALFAYKNKLQQFYGLVDNHNIISNKWRWIHFYSLNVHAHSHACWNEVICHSLGPEQHLFSLNPKAHMMLIEYWQYFSLRWALWFCWTE